MDKEATAGLSQLPPEMLSFALRQADSAALRPRLGQLLFKGRHAIETPQYVATTSRGVVPHVSPDNIKKNTAISAVYIALEDFLEKSPRDAPIFHTPISEDGKIIRKYTSLPDQCLSILGPRRVPPLQCPAQNTHSSISISTSVGFSSLKAEDYGNAVRLLEPDVCIALADVVDTEHTSVKRIEKMAVRTHAWLRDFLGTHPEEFGDDVANALTWANILPIWKEQQSFYLSDLADEFAGHLSGLCLYTPVSTSVIPPNLHHLPRISLSDPPTPHALITAVSNGVDLITTPFVTKTSEQGIAFCFSFTTYTRTSAPVPQPLGIDLWSSSHATSLTPLSPGCTCYTCTRHHSAYIHHLLAAKEMLAWTLLQIHNFAVMDAFFQDIRDSIAKGTFETDAEEFSRVYEAEMPGQTGQGPRIRGYQMKSVGGGETRKNPKAYGRLDDQLEKRVEAEEGIARPDAPAAEMVESGFAERAE